MRQPKLIDVAVLVKCYYTKKRKSDGEMVPQRGFNCDAKPCFHRFRLAFGVLIGKYDALEWDVE